MPVTYVLHSVAYNDILEVFRRITGFAPVYHPVVEKQLGPLYEQAIDKLESSLLREDEFQEIQQMLVNYGMKDLRW